ncbi:unnamed protein product, partial [Prorocentrum cordatum]
MAWLTSVLQSASSVTSSVVAGARGGLAAGGRCDCHCEWAAAPDQGLLQLLQRQLDRCGPEQLHGQVCPALPPPPVATLALVGVGLFFTGVLFGSCLDGWRPGEARPEWFSQLQRGSRVLVRYEGYPLWHERLVGARLAPSRWVMATPSGDVYDEDLMESDGVHRVGPLGGLGAGMANVEVFRFVNLTAQEKRELLESCEDYARDNEGDLDIEAEARQVLVAQHVLPPRGGGGPGAAHAPGAAGVAAAALPGAAAGLAWVAAESRHGFTHGQAVDAVGQLLASGDRGVLTVPGVGSLCVAVPAMGDLRTLPSGSSSWTPTQRHFWWRNLLQVSPSDAGVEEHAYISEVLERACVFDQLNCSELETFEVLSRRYQLWEELYAPELPAAKAGEEGDGSWLDERRMFLGSSRSKGAALVCPRLEGHAAGELAQESAILEEKRKGPLLKLTHSAGGPLRERSPALLRPQPLVVGSGMAFGPQPPGDRPRDLLPFPGGRALDELLLGTAGGGLSVAGKRKARRRRGEEVWLRAGLDALSELGGGRRASSDAQVTAAQASAARSLAKLDGGRGPPPTDVDPLGAWKVLQGSGGGCVDSSVADSLDATYQPGRISLPQSRAGALPLCDVVPDDLQCMLSEGSGLFRDPAEAQAALRELGPAIALDPVPRLKGFMCGCFLAELLGKGILEKAAVVKETSGAFFVKRKDGLLRLIFDTRRSNCHFTPPPCTSLASGESLADLESEPGARLWVASAGIEVCFYQCELPASFRPLFVPPPILARYLPARWCERLGLAGGDVECAFQARVVPVGWAWAVRFIQRAHEHLLSSRLSSTPWVRGKVPATPACEGPSKLCFIDNLAVVSDKECEAVNGITHMLTTLDGAGGPEKSSPTTVLPVGVSKLRTGNRKHSQVDVVAAAWKRMSRLAHAEALSLEYSPRMLGCAVEAIARAELAGGEDTLGGGEAPDAVPRPSAPTVALLAETWAEAERGGLGSFGEAWYEELRADPAFACDLGLVLNYPVCRARNVSRLVQLLIDLMAGRAEPPKAAAQRLHAVLRAATALSQRLGADELGDTRRRIPKPTQTSEQHTRTP